MSKTRNNLEPIAVTGIGCRFPGGICDPASFWDVLRAGRNVITETPPDRWDLDSFYHPNPEKPGRMATRFGGYLENIDEFDAAFFGFSPREAAFLDPQQRLLLETVWEAFEDGGHPPEGMAGTRTCVFVGEFALDYKLLLLSPLQRELIGAHTCTGSFATMIANRISHWFDLRGPSVTLDTACSSSLVAVHLACQSLWSGESDYAVVGGVNAMFTPEWTLAVSKGGFLSPGGQCRAFSANADGYVRSEGCGVVLLKPLAAALARGDRIYALIRGTASNQDGRTPGITVPSMPAQEALLREAYAGAGVTPASVHYVEAHGTGTAVGDPAEAGALGRVLGEDRPANRPCLLGSVKTNLGHLEAAAGAAGLIKAALCLYHQAVPANLHFDQPNPAIDFARLGLRVPTRLEPWPEDQGKRFAGVNSFGFGGANAHVVLSDALPRLDEAPADSGRPCLLAISARSEQALKAMAERCAALLAAPPDSASLADVAYSAGARRGHHSCRLAVVAASREEARARLRAFQSDDPNAPPPIAGRADAARRRRLVFVYAGMGPQWAGMGRDLVAAEPAFRRTIERCDAILGRLAGWSLMAELAKGADSRIDETFIAQPAIFAFQAALTDLWRSWGIVPDEVVGHSVGEAAAHYAAGVLSLDDALAVIYHRSRLQHRTAGAGAMLAVGATRADVEPLVAKSGGRVSIAAVNSPSSMTLSGDRDALAAIETELNGRGLFARFLNVSVPYHSRAMEPLRDELLASLATLGPRAAAIPLVSTVTGARAEGPELGAAYWWQNVRQPVQFADAMATLLRADPDTVFLEISPHPVLIHSIRQCAAASGAQAEAIAGARRRQPALPDLLAAAGRLYVSGRMPDWSSLCPGGRFVGLPAYAWQREKHWLESEASARERLGRHEHPLLGMRVGTALRVWQRDVTSPSLRYLLDHQVHGAAVFPGAAFAELAFAAGREAAGKDAHMRIDDLAFHSPLLIDERATILVQTSLASDGQTFEIHSSNPGAGGIAWRKHAAGLLTFMPAAETPCADLASLRRACPTPVPIEACYRAFAGTGLEYGPAFRLISALAVGPDSALAEFAGDGRADGYLVHPPCLDNGLQTLLAAFLLGKGQAAGNTSYLPMRIAKIALHDCAAAVRSCFAQVVSREPHAFTGRILLLGADGRVALEASGIRCQALTLDSDGSGELPSLYATQWRRVEPAARPAADGSAAESAGGRWLIVTDTGGVGSELAARLAAQGMAVLVAAHNADMAEAVRPAPGDGPLTGIVHLGGLDAPAMDAERPPDLKTAFAPGCLSLLSLAQALSAIGPLPPPRLWLVTRGAAHVPAAPAKLSPYQAAAWGLGRAIANEHPDFACSLVDLDPEATAADAAAALARVLSGNGSERELALRGPDTHAPRLERLRGRDLRFRARTIAPEDFHGHMFRLEALDGAGLDSMRFMARARPDPAPGEVEVEVRAAGLNFKDVAKATGLLSDESLSGAYSGRALGLECSGVVTRCGDGVAAFKPGDAVACFPRHAFAPFALADARLACRKPERLSFEEAAGIPLVFVTAWYALHHLARLAKGERVLIHSASGGVGLAAIQLARRAGAEIFATAGSPAKRALLESLGIRHVMDSRTTAFADRVMELTGNRGVDVALSALAGAGADAGLAALAPGGRFIELGKSDAGQNRRIGLAQFQNNISYFAVDIDKLATERPAFVGGLLNELMQLFADGRLTPAPTLTAPLARARAHFETMAHAGHTGKIVFQIGAEPVSVLEQAAAALPIAADKTHLVIGGLKGFGLEAARWLASRGARHLALASRSGVPAAAEEPALRDLSRIAGVRLLALDVAGRDDVARSLAGLAADMPPLGGVIHCANVYEDAPVAGTTADMFLRAMAPKAGGAMNLHAACAGMNLDFFILFSSISSVTGNPGQAGYCAANAFLDAFAHWRRSRGLPGLAINWGPMAAAGYVARNSAVEAHLRRIGYDLLLPGKAFEHLEACLRMDAGQAVAADIRWPDWARHHPIGASPRFSALAGTPESSQAAAGGATPDHSFSQRLAQAAPDERRALIAAHITRQTAEVLGWDAGKPLDPDRGFFELGMDSMLSLELRNRLQRSFSRPLPATLVFKHPSIASLADYFAAELTRGCVKNGDGGPSPSSGNNKTGENEKASGPASHSCGLLDTAVELTTAEPAAPPHERPAPIGNELDKLGDSELAERLKKTIETMKRHPLASHRK